MDRIRFGMIGGGQGAFIGAVHRIAARMDDQYEFCAGALSSDPDRATESARALGLPADRCYRSFTDMIEGESTRDDGIEAVSIVTPNNVHYPAAKACLEANLHVICDKPLTTTSAQAFELVATARKHDRILAVTYNYTGYPMVRQARAMVDEGLLGQVRVVQVEYAQDWLTESLESTGQKQARWRTDPNQCGAGGCVGDIGTHAYHLACFVSGLEATSLCADLTTFVEGRALDDNVNVMLRFSNGARGMLWASQVAPGNENALRLRVYGDKGGLSWSQEDPNYLHFSPFGEPARRISRGGAGAGEAAAAVSRIPAGHPEGYLEGFATLYREVAEEIRASRRDETTGVAFPRGDDGAKGVAFIESAVASSASGAIWTDL